MRTSWLFCFISLLITSSINASEFEYSDNVQINSFFKAVKVGDIKEIKRLLKSGVDVNSVNKNNNVAIKLTFYSNDFNTFKTLLSLGANPNYCVPKYKTCLLHSFVSPNKLSFIKLLVESGANINVQDATGATPLLTAASLNQYDIAYYLIQSGADPTISNNWGKTIWDRIKDNNISKESDLYKWQQKTITLIKSGG